MNLKAQLSAGTSRKVTDITISAIGNDKEHFRELIYIILQEKDPLPMRASWVAEGITANYPELIMPYLNSLILNLENFTHPGTLRNLLKIFSSINIPQKHHGRIADFCFASVSKEKMPVSVKVYAIEIIANLVMIYPELKNELLAIIDEQLPGNSPGFISCARRIKKLLNTNSV